MRKGILVALLLTIITPLILSYIFLTLLTPIDWTRMDNGFPQILGILIFSSLAFAYSVPLFGYGYVIPLFIWLITGLFVGLFSKSAKRGVLITLLGLCIQILLIFILVQPNPSYIPAFLVSSENVGLLGGFSLDFLITLGFFLCWWALLLPGSVLGGIMGGLVSRSTISE
jgi:hypothetical protein